MTSFLVLMLFLGLTAGVSYLFQYLNQLNHNKPTFAYDDSDDSRTFSGRNSEYLNLYLRGVFQLAGYIGKCTDDQNPFRNSVIQGYIRKLADSPENAEICKTAFFAGCDEYYNPRQAMRFFERYSTYSRRKPNIRYMMNFIITIALCDGRIPEIQQERLNEICDLLNFSRGKLDAMIRECQRLQPWKNFAPQEEDFSSRSAYDWRDQQEEYRKREEKRKTENEKRRQHGDYRNRYENHDESSGESSPVSRGELEEACRILGVAVSASDRQIKRAFHKLIRKYHPDLIKKEDLPEEMAHIYDLKAKTINKAYETVCRARGM